MLTVKSKRSNNDQLALLRLTPRKRQRVLRAAGRRVRRDSRSRLKLQKGLNGRRWKGRSDGSKKRMLRKLGRRLIVKTTSDQADVTFGNNLTGKIARLHQEGIDQTMTAGNMEKIHGQVDYKEPATRKQAKALREAGYKIRKKRGSGWKSPSLKWIVTNLSNGKAGLILRILLDKERKRAWKIPTQERSFLGQERQEMEDLKNFMLDEAMRLKR